MVGDTALRCAPHAAVLLRAVLATTLKHWRGAVELDLIAAFDRGGRGKGCLATPDLDVATCAAVHEDLRRPFQVHFGADP